MYVGGDGFVSCSWQRTTSVSSAAGAESLTYQLLENPGISCDFQSARGRPSPTQ